MKQVDRIADCDVHGQDLDSMIKRLASESRQAQRDAERVVATGQYL